MNGVVTMAELDRQLGIPGVARVSEGNSGLARVEITGAFGEGEMYLHGAHVTSWRPAGNEQVLFVSTKSHWEEGQAIRGGIPICFPWFRAKSDDPHAPAHGFVRTKQWQLESIVKKDNGVAVTMFTQSDEHTRKWWPGEFRLVHRVTFGSELRLELVCTNTGTTPFRFEEALHTYNRIANIQDARCGRELRSAVPALHQLQCPTRTEGKWRRRRNRAGCDPRLHQAPPSARRTRRV